MAKESNIADLSYEQAFTELQKIVEDLEAEVGNLDQSLKLFERGQALAKHCAELLEKAELKVRQISEDGDLSEIE